MPTSNTLHKPCVPSLNTKGEVWVWLGRNHEGLFSPAMEEVLYEAHQLATGLQTTLAGLALTAPNPNECEWLARWGVGKVYTLLSKSTANLKHAAMPCAFTTVRQGLFAQIANLPVAAKPCSLLLLADSFGRASAPLFAAMLGGVCVSNAVQVQGPPSHRLQAVRPLWGGGLETKVEALSQTPLVVSILANAVGEGEPPYAKHTKPTLQIVPFGELQAPQPNNSARQKAAAFEVESLPNASAWSPPDPKKMALVDAERIVAFGRGAFHAKAIALIECLATALGAVVACTRPAADEGWLPFERQVGLTGAVVSPQLYVAIGISGAPYHMVGLRNVKHLIAINQDPEAPIFSAAHLGIVGDLYKVLPPLLKAIGKKHGS